MAGEHRLPVVRRGPADGPLVVFAQPLFEELNRCRRLIADVADALAANGIASVLPDLPATGDHEDLGPWQMARCRDALTAFVETQAQICRIVSMRGGVLLVHDKLTPRTYALAPVKTGRRLLDDLIRAHSMAERERSGKTISRDQVEKMYSRDTVHLAGYYLAAESAFALDGAEAPMVDRRRELGSAEGAIPGPLVWRQADPQRAPETAKEIAADISSWMHR